MLRLEDGHYATRLPLPKVRELAILTERFNTLAGALDTARDENSRLYRQLITVQEEERRAIANELHDEAGPCLFGITANASSIQNLADQMPGKRTAEITRRVGEILSITERLKLLNRALLKKLKPAPLGRVKLVELLDELIAGFQRSHPDTHIAVSIGTLADTYGEAIDLTLYRCIQEGITNAIRHGKAASLTIDLAETPALPRQSGRKQRARLALILSDDGRGIDPDTPKGFGLTTMSERVRSLGGSCVIESAPSKGTTVQVEIPVERTKTPRRRTPELVEGTLMTRVLVIDDHPIVLQGCRQLLEDAGVNQIVQAQTLADGFRLYRTQKPDVIIVDLAMRTGALGGLSFIRRLRLHDQRTPILVFTMHSRSGHRQPRARGRRHWLRAQGHLLRRGAQGLSEGAREPALSQPRPRLRGRLHGGEGHHQSLAPHDGAGAADPGAGGRRQALRRHRRASSRKLQDRREYLHAAQSETRRAHAAGADAHRHSTPTLCGGEDLSRLIDEPQTVRGTGVSQRSRLPRRRPRSRMIRVFPLPCHND